MSRKERFTPQEKEQACIDYIEGNRSRSEICRELYISTSTMNIPVRRVLPHENIQMVGLTTTELSNKTSNNWLNGIAFYFFVGSFVAEGHRAGCIKTLNIYVKPEEYKAYYVINDKFFGSVDLF